MKKLFITGATGFVGSHILEKYSNNKECEIFGTSYKSTVDVSRWIDEDHVIELNLLDKSATAGVIENIITSGLSSPYRFW